MHESKHDPLPFIVLLVLILLLIAAGLYLAARLVVAPQPREMVEATLQPTSTQPPEDEIQFFPWNAHTPEEVGGFIRPDHEAEYRAWHKENLVIVPEILGFSGMEASADREQAGYYLGFWTDCPVTAANGQPALLDVAYGQENGALGMYWVARSTGSPPTQEQKEAAIAQVETDIQEWIGGQGETVTRLQDLLMNLWKELDYAHIVYDDTDRESAGAEAMHPVLEPMKYIWSEVSTLRGDGLTMEKLTQEAAFYGLQIQIVTTQRHVVLVLQRRDTTTGQLCTVGAYYDMVLGDYSGLVVNRAHAVGE